MPLYEFACDSCNTKEDRVLPLADYMKEQQCKCGQVMRKCLSAPAVSVDYPAYQCPVSGATIEGRKQHEENLKRQGCRIWEPGETEAVRRNKDDEERQFARHVETTIDRQLEAMPTRKKEQLVSELKSGADLALTRN